MAAELREICVGQARMRECTLGKMDRHELRGMLEARGVRPSADNLDSAVADEAYCMERSRGGWSVYYFERGKQK